MNIKIRIIQMKRLTLILLISIGFFPSIKSQTVDSIKVEQAGELIKVHYKILNSNEFQTFRITVYCSINGGLKSELKSLSGDYGNSVVGGRPNYMVLWDVLKDVDEVKSADFSVKAELLKDETPPISKKEKKERVNKHNLNIMASAQLPGPGFGIRAGYMGSFGFSFQYLSGKAVLIPNSGYTDRPNLKHINLDFTKRIINKESFQMHMILVGGVGQTVSKEIVDWDPFIYYDIKSVPEYGLGFAVGLTKLTFELTFSHLFYDLVNDETTMWALSKRNFLTLSFGLRF